MILLSIALLVVVAALTLYYLAYWVLKALCFYCKRLLCVTTLGCCVWTSSAWSALEIFKFFAFLGSVFAFLGLIWWTLDTLWLLVYSWVKKAVPVYGAVTRRIHTTSSPATASATACIPPTPPTPPKPTQAAHTFWGEFSPAARGVIVLASPLFALPAVLSVAVVGSTGLLAAIHHGWTLLRKGFNALGTKILKGIQHILAVLRAGMVVMSTGS